MNKYYDLYKQLDNVNFSVYDECPISFEEAKSIPISAFRIETTEHVFANPKRFEF